MRVCVFAETAELTFLQQSWAHVPARLENVLPFFVGRFRFLNKYVVFVLIKAGSDLHWQYCQQSCVSCLYLDLSL